MELNANLCNAIAQTLPTGYYCGRKVGVSVTSDKFDTPSRYNPQADTIEISYGRIEESVKALADGKMTAECAVRSALYHELSHVLLTPYNMDKGDEILNCFEDERVETLLNDYYMDVNFKQQLFNLKGETPNINPLDPMSKFEALVRYRYGKPEFLERVKKIINDYADINANMARVYSYERAIHDLYEDVKNDDTPAEEMKQDTETLQKDLKANIDKSGSKPKQENEKGEEEQNSMEQGENSEGDGEGEGEGLAENDGEQGEGEEIEGATGNPAHGKMRSKMADIGKEVLDPNKNYCLSEEQKSDLEKARKTIEMMIANFNKKNSGGSGYNGYSGIFNPRAVVRDDYKYFDRKATINGNNPFGKCHLNLLIDKSGSFWANQDIVNALLRMLTEIEDNNPCFSLDVGFISTRIQPTTHDTRIIRCGGGNAIDPKDYKAYMDSKRKINCYNYDIVLFDGDACCDGRMSGIKQFAAVDRENTTVITDPDNERYMRNENKFKKARVIVTSHYTQELINNIVKAVGRMFS